MTAVFKLQKQLVNHENAKLLAIRKITQDNLGKRTAGVDKISKLNPAARLELLKEIRIGNQTDKIRRVTIMKPDGKERYLGIPTTRDRIKQCLQRTPKFILDADIKGCFDEINYSSLLRKINTFPMFRE